MPLPTVLPAEFQGVPPERIKQNIARLEMDMAAEIESIKLRYEAKIAYMQRAYELSQPASNSFMLAMQSFK